MNQQRNEAAPRTKRHTEQSGYVRFDPPTRGYNILLQGNPIQSTFRVVAQGTLCEKVWTFASEREAWRKFDRLSLTIRHSVDLPLDGVPSIDLFAFRHYLYSLPRGACAGTYMTIHAHPLALWCTYLTGKNFWFNAQEYTSCHITEIDADGFPSKIQATAALRPLPFDASIYLQRTYPQKKERVLRDEAIEDLDTALCIARDMQAMAHALGAEPEDAR